MAWMRRDGTMTVMRALRRDWRAPQFSPDGKRIVFHLDDGRQLNIYTYEWARDFTTRLTFDPSVDSNPLWSPDGRSIVFSSTPSVKQMSNLYWVSADGSGEPHRLTESPVRQLDARDIRNTKIDAVPQGRRRGRPRPQHLCLFGLQSEHRGGTLSIAPGQTPVT